MLAQGRRAATTSGFADSLAQYIVDKGKTARADKFIERLGSMATNLALLSADSNASEVHSLCLDFCLGLKESLEKSQGKGSILEAYSFLSIFIKL